MAEYKVPLQDIHFAYNDVLDFNKHYEQLLAADDATPDMVAAILEEAAKFSEQVVSPLNAVGDVEGCHWQDAKVSTPTGFKAAFDQFKAGGWTGLSQPVAFGGQGLPVSLNTIFYEMLTSANHAWAMYPSLTWGAINTIKSHASEALQRDFLPLMVQGEWSGTMCLTEAHCGSDLGLLRTKAIPNDDGTYAISGSKIFISAGEHDLTDNIVHIVLARLPDAPEGVKGISLFIVPKYIASNHSDKKNIDHHHSDLTLDQNALQYNNVQCGSIEHKMGIHGNATCVMNFDGARGYLIGQANKGLHCMFTFINESRLGVAQQGHGHIERSYQGSLAYAHERLQMRAPHRVLPDKPADPIIAHPDVRRMLLTQKAYAEGGRLLNYYCAQQVDIHNAGDTEQTRKEAEEELALLTPIAKGFLTEVSMEATQYGVQIFGGHGYIREWGMEQEYRDTRITSIYEGTNGIQALDLLARKILPSGGEALRPFAAKVQAFCQSEQGDRMKPFQALVNQQFSDWLTLTMDIARRGKDDPNAIGMAAYDYLMFAGYATLAYFLAKSASAANRKLMGKDSAHIDAQYYENKIAVCQFYFDRILPRNAVHASCMRAELNSVFDWQE
ncbi:3-methylmercaptopropionyl-CoA dehydrogenase [Thalassocella blandensis]|nr:3-methylmercaptopropionyl-CoA dehydrogenase [Thalassocella blandensis]